MQVRALMVVRALVLVALVPAFTGCASEGERLDRADLPPPPAPTEPARRWAAPEDAAIRPGALLRTAAGDCPISFVFRTRDDGALFVATTAYCVRELPIGALAAVGEEDLALLIYSSMQTMQEVGERDPEALEYNDLAIFYVDRAAAPRVSPSFPDGGPVELADGAAYGPGARVRLFAPSASVPDAPAWREGVVTGSAGEWALLAYSVLPGAPGELGGGVLDADGRAIGVVVTLGVVPNPGANGIARLDTMLAYAAEHAQVDIILATA